MYCDYTNIIVEIIWVVIEVDDDLLRQDDPLVVVPLFGVVVPDGHVEPLDLDIHHAVGGRDDEVIGESRAAAEMNVSAKKTRVSSRNESLIKPTFCIP